MLTQGKYPAKGKILARLSEEQKAFLASTADLVWWKTAEETLAWPEYLVRQIMRYGDLEQTVMLEKLFSEDILRKVLLAAEPGQLNGRSWNFWYVRLFHCHDYKKIPPPPSRTLAAP